MAPTGATGRRRSPPLSDEDPTNRYKQAAACAAAELVEDEMRVGLGSGSTLAYVIPALAERGLRRLQCVAASPQTEQSALELGLPLRSLDDVGELDIAIDGADQIDPQGWLVKGGGGAHTRERIIAAAARTFVVIASPEKAVARLGPPIPLELLRFGVQHTLAELSPAQLRDWPPSPDGGLIADYLGPVEDPRELAARLSAAPGVIDHGMFPPEMVSVILIAGEDGVERRAGAKPQAR